LPALDVPFIMEVAVSKKLYNDIKDEYFTYILCASYLSELSGLCGVEFLKNASQEEHCN
jgi:hypothetical protein